LRKRVLLLDCEERTRNFISSLLQEEGIEVKSARDPREALERAKREEFDLLLADINFPGIERFELIDKIKALQPHIIFALLIKEKFPFAETTSSEYVTREELEEFEQKIKRIYQSFLQFFFKLYSSTLE